ncbi:enolase C-terminal domain-like protein [Nocardia arthritidis]|uniref:Mandelate racemase n=1 Tax=Nocardia arthritidis TaxID=228602 RepID=A0A6G9YMA8_9NOCA|nr:enolase C-terminal domain-like protein [Nocardia arthritidis]QIS14419.1 mandelate racemase [Nocardia arthritidis]
MNDDLRIGDAIDVAAYRFPTPQPEADGTLAWDQTTAVVVTIDAGGRRGTGWTYSGPATAAVIETELVPVLRELSPFDIGRCRNLMWRHCRNIGSTALVAHALSAVDIALWDLKARLLGVALTTLFGAVRPVTPVYGSGGFINLDDDQLGEQIDGWRAAGCRAVKIKIGADPGRDLARTALATKLIGPDTQLMVDANGAYSVGQARRVGAELDRLGVSWFEEPVTSDDPPGLAQVRAAVHCDIAAGEYAYGAYDAAALIGAVDCLQLDVTRCGGYTGFLACAAVAAAHGLDVSAHCAPALSAPVTAAIPNLRHIEWFIDHARLEPLLAEGVPRVAAGAIRPHADDPADPCGHGMRIAETAAPYRLPTHG